MPILQEISPNKKQKHLQTTDRAPCSGGPPYQRFIGAIAWPPDCSIWLVCKRFYLLNGKNSLKVNQTTTPAASSECSNVIAYHAWLTGPSIARGKRGHKFPKHSQWSSAEGPIRCSVSGNFINSTSTSLEADVRLFLSRALKICRKPYHSQHWGCRRQYDCSNKRCSCSPLDISSPVYLETGDGDCIDWSCIG
jgi:hypothetical protein